MTRNFEKAKNNILRESTVNGGLDTQNLFDIIVASHEDFVVEGTATRKQLTEHIKVDRATLVEVHQMLGEMKSESTKIAEGVQASVDELKTFVGGRGEAIAQAKAEVSEEHQAFHDEYVAGRDRELASRFEAQQKSGLLGEQTFRDMVVGWRFSKWLLGILLVVIVGWALPFWADSCSRQQYWGREAPAIIASPTPTSATP